MDISNINGSNAYAANNSTKPPVDSTLLENQNQKAAGTDPNQETTRAVQQAFEVDITQEAQDKMAMEAKPPVQEASNQKSGADQSTLATQEARQIINIVA